MSDKPPPPPGLVFSEGNTASRPETCGHCFYAEQPVGGTPPPAHATEEQKAVALRSGYCRRANPGPSEKRNVRPHWPVVNLDKDYCGNGTV